ncbi:MAG: hypothetical protein P4L83_03785 [Nevskia sp.]|nr:hypothetical protein [Nevskia sp.]
MQTGWIRFASLLAALLLCPALCWSAPQLFSNPYYESSTRGDPGDLLLLSGYPMAPGDTVVYQSVSDTTKTPQRPPSVQSSTAGVGFASLASVADVPYSLTVQLPSAMIQGRSYALWVLDARGNWSNPVMINDARPLWFTPDYIYQTAATAGLPRVLKIVGRNLQPSPGQVTQVQLSGPSTYVLTAANANNDPSTTPALERYVAKVQLPASMTPGTYTVKVSRDGVSWVPLAGENSLQQQTLVVQPDPLAPAQFAVSDPRYGGCRPRTSGLPDQDATPCILAAVNAAYAAGGGTVTLGAGTWPVMNVNNVYNLPGDGFVLPPGVSLMGAGAASTILERGAAFPAWESTFALQGNNTVQGITFHDAAVYTPQTSAASPMLKIGAQWYWAHNYRAQGAQATQVSNVVITQNTFDKPFVAISNGGLPVDHVFITNNIFGGAYSTAIYLFTDQNYANDPDSQQHPYQFSDSVIAYNTFYPGSFVSADNTQGSIASQIATSTRLDFSDNTADGTSTQYFYNPATDKKGWRAGFFWSTGHSQEMTLVSQNTITCSGDKAGDGEAIVYDGGGSEWGGFTGPQPAGAPPPGSGARPVVSAAAGNGSSTVTLLGSLVSTFPTSNGNGPTAITPGYYQGFWLQIVQGPGLGQWRKVAAVATGTDGKGNPTVSLTVIPALDVLPQANSLAILARGYWQNATVDNFVDQRQPLCTKANAKRPGGGVISWYSSTADSAIEGNQQYDTDGILLNHVYKLPGPGPSPDAVSFMSAIQSSNEVRNNLIDGEYDWSASNSASGVQLVYGATHDTAAPPVLGYATAVAGNTIIHADTANPQTSVNQSLGAIGLGPSWWTGPLDSTQVSGWKMADATLLFNNTIDNVGYSAADGVDRLGVGLSRGWGTSTTAPIAWRTVMSGNTCSSVSTLLGDTGTGTVYYCPTSQSSSCHCQSRAAGLVVSASSSAGTVANGASVSYSATVKNYGYISATGVTLSIEPPAGIRIVSIHAASASISCNINTYTCNLGTMPVAGNGGSSVTVQVYAAAAAPGTWPVMFSVTHHEGDMNVGGNAAEVDTIVTQ